MYMMELLDKSLMDKVPLPALFARTIEVLKFFNDKGFNILAIRYFEMMLLISLGYQPVIDRCVACGRKDAAAAGFDLSAGGMLCRQCLPDKGRFIPMNGETMALARLLAAGRLTAITRVKVSPAALHQLEIFLEKYMEYHLERKFYMKNTITTLKRTIGIPD
jgi:DNA repair protein RecO (recombination protein O)